jgi:DUF1680 family protein
MISSRTAMSGVQVRWGAGPVGDAVNASFVHRLTQFIRDEESEPIQLFSKEMRANSMSGEWYGEHAGKWLVAAGHVWRRTGSEEVANSIVRVVSFLKDRQETDGYLGTYSEDYAGRFTHESAPQVRTWDTWVHAWMILGLLQVSDVPGTLGVVETAKKIGDLFVSNFSDTDRSLVELGNHQGLSSAVMIQPLVELSTKTSDPKYADLAVQILQQMEDRGLPILTGLDSGRDISEVGTGKAYQLCWILVGLAALYKATEEKRLLVAAEYWWENIATHHLTPLGGPWGGIATHKEVFNARGFFSPNGLTETCSTASWMSLCRELFLITGHERYAAAYETALLNGMLGAMDENGQDWCYFTFPNGRRNNTYHWACCKSSGAMALEESALMGATLRGEGIRFNLWHSLEADASFGDKVVMFEQVVDCDNQSASIKLGLEGEADLNVAVRLPKGSSLRSVFINGELLAEPAIREGYIEILRKWRSGDVIRIQVSFELKIHSYTHSVDHHGQEIVRTDYAHLTWGPYVYATGLIDGYKKEETLRLAKLTPEAPFTIRKAWLGPELPTIDFIQPGRPPIPFQPYFEAGGRHDGAWRSTWLQVAWQ